MVVPAEDLLRSVRKRAFKPKVRSGCFTCKARRVKCDEGKPACDRCTRSGRECAGYGTPKGLQVAPRPLAAAPAVESPVESRALELFFLKTAPQLAGYFEGAFFQGSVLQASLTEPAIRQAIAGLAVSHEQMAFGRPDSKGFDISTPLLLYNRAIRSTIEKTRTDPNPLPLVAMMNILFTCFEFFRGNKQAAAVHVKSGIQLLEQWRARYHTSARQPWGQQYKSFEACFMETEIAPLLSVFRSNLSERNIANNIRLILNPINDKGDLVLPDRFETPQQARVGLIDVIGYSTWCFDRLEQPGGKPHPNNESVQVLITMKRLIAQWEAKYDDMVRRRSPSWDTKQKKAAKAVHIIKLAMGFGVRSYLAASESAWDPGRAEYEEMLELIEELVFDQDRFPSDGFRHLNLDFGLIFSFHTLAWKCRWPHLRRRALGLMDRIPQRERFMDTHEYRTIFACIMELEEEPLKLAPGKIPPESLLPPEHARIHDFTLVVDSVKPGGYPVYAVTFWSKPHGLHGPWHRVTKNIQPGSAGYGETALPVSLLSRYQSHSPTRAVLKFPIRQLAN